MKRLLVIAALTISGFAAQAQGFYFKAGLGYALPQAGQTLDNGGYPYSGSSFYVSGSSFSSFEAKRVSFSSGPNATLGAGYAFNSNLALELNANIGLSNTKYTATHHFPVTAGTYDIELTQYTESMQLLLPSVVLRSGKKKAQIYLRASVIVPANVKITAESKEHFEDLNGDNQANYITEQDVRTYSGLGFGGATGFSYNISPNMKLWGEVALMSLSLYVRETELVMLQRDGINLLSNVPQQNRTINYANQNVNGAEPTYSLPFSNIGVNIGVSYHLGAMTAPPKPPARPVRR
jgi:hypothetical protein